MSDERLVEMIRVHLGRYSEAGMLDVYKLLHQATFGPGHLITNRKSAREWLEQEAGLIVPSAEKRWSRGSCINVRRHRFEVLHSKHAIIIRRPSPEPGNRCWMPSAFRPADPGRSGDHDRALAIVREPVRAGR